MVIQGIDLKSKNTITYILDSLTQIRDWGVYVTIDKIYTYESRGTVDFDNTFEKVSNLNQLEFDTNTLSIHLGQGSYFVEFNEKSFIDRNTIGIFQPRSALLRSGVQVIGSPLVKGKNITITGLMHVLNPKGITLLKHARIGKYIFLEVENRALGFDTNNTYSNYR